MTRPSDTGAGDLARAYLSAKHFVIELGYGDEVGWMESLRFDNVDEPTFLREAAWVVLSAGFAATVVSKRFPLISRAFFDWQSARRIVRHRTTCRKSALSCFRNPLKIDAIIEIAAHVDGKGFRLVQESIRQEGLTYLAKLPFMGPATSRHLAKNLGFQEVKPDRHLTRLAAALGYSTPSFLCEEIANAVGEKLSVVDLVLWRYATLTSNYVDRFLADRLF